MKLSRLLIPLILFPVTALAVPIDNFSPRYNYTVSASTTSADQTMTQNTPPSGSPMTALEVFNNTASVAHVRWGKGAQTAVTTDYAVGPGADKIISMGSGYDHVAVILESGTGNVYVSLGDGS